MTIIEAYNHPEFLSGTKLIRVVGWKYQALTCVNDGSVYAFPKGNNTPFYPNRGGVLAEWELVTVEAVEAERKTMDNGNVQS